MDGKEEGRAGGKEEGRRGAGGGKRERKVRLEHVGDSNGGWVPKLVSAKDVNGVVVVGVKVVPRGDGDGRATTDPVALYGRYFGG